jgi:tRNA pseudouridine38-40 synthase
MARLIVGALLEVGKGKINAADLQKILNDKKYTNTIPIAQPKGLCLKDVQYN